MKKHRLALFTRRPVLTALVCAPCAALCISLLLHCHAEGNTQCYLTSKCVASVTDHTSAETDISVISRHPTELQIQWSTFGDISTASDEMEFRVVYAIAPTVVNTLAGDDPPPAGVTIATDWTENEAGAQVTGLKPTTTYTVAVLMRNKRGQVTLLGPRTIQTEDPTLPTPGPSITFSETKPTSVQVSWGAATDALTPTEQLTYRLVRADSAAAIDTLAKIKGDLASDVTLEEDWTPALTTAAVAGLSGLHTYYFAVAVRGQYENYAFYAPASMQTPDGTAPTAGSAITVSNITGTTATLAWGEASDNLTAGAQLRYKVVMATSAAAIDTIAEIDALPASNVVMDFTAAATGKNLTGLVSGSINYYAVVVEDEAGNEAIYDAIKVQTPDVVPPTTDASIVFTHQDSETGVTASWSAATDNVSTSLDYKLVMNTDGNYINTADKANSGGGGTVTIMNWKADTLTSGVTGLTRATAYYFAVVVRDKAGNLSLYGPSQYTTPDLTPPTVGTNITLSNPDLTSMTVSWGAASDNVTTVANLEYKVVKALTATSISTLTQIDAITKTADGLVLDWTALGATPSTTASSLNSLTDYYFAVAVRDAAHHEALYTPQMGTTAGKIFTTILSYTGKLGGITGADAKCQAAGNGKPSDGKTYKALISLDTGVPATSRIACTTANCSGGAGEHTDWVLRSNVSYRRPDNTPISTTDSKGLLTFNLSNSISPSSNTFWTGLHDDTGVHNEFTPDTANNCQSWNAESGNPSAGRTGSSGSIHTDAMDTLTTYCNQSAYLYCVEQ